MRSIAFTSRTRNPDLPDVTDLSPEDVSAHNREVVLVDVREPSEYVGELGHIAEAQLIALGTLPEKIGILPKDQTIIFVCRSGGRSARATSYAQSAGFKDVYNMKGGMLLWNSLGLPVVRES